MRKKPTVPALPVEQQLRAFPALPVANSPQAAVPAFVDRENPLQQRREQDRPHSRPLDQSTTGNRLSSQRSRFHPGREDFNAADAALPGHTAWQERQDLHERRQTAGERGWQPASCFFEEQPHLQQQEKWSGFHSESSAFEEPAVFIPVKRIPNQNGGVWQARPLTNDSRRQAAQPSSLDEWQTWQQRQMQEAPAAPIVAVAPETGIPLTMYFTTGLSMCPDIPQEYVPYGKYKAWATSERAILPEGWQWPVDTANRAASVNMLSSFGAASANLFPENHTQERRPTAASTTVGLGAYLDELFASHTSPAPARAPKERNQKYEPPSLRPAQSNARPGPGSSTLSKAPEAQSPKERSQKYEPPSSQLAQSNARLDPGSSTLSKAPEAQKFLPSSRQQADRRPDSADLLLDLFASGSAAPTTAGRLMADASARQASTPSTPGHSFLAELLGTSSLSVDSQERTCSGSTPASSSSEGGAQGSLPAEPALDFVDYILSTGRQQPAQPLTDEAKVTLTAKEPWPSSSFDLAGLLLDSGADAFYLKEGGISSASPSSSCKKFEENGHHEPMPETKPFSGQTIKAKRCCSSFSLEDLLCGPEGTAHSLSNSTEGSEGISKDERMPKTISEPPSAQPGDAFSLDQLLGGLADSQLCSAKSPARKHPDSREHTLQNGQKPKADSKPPAAQPGDAFSLDQLLGGLADSPARKHPKSSEHTLQVEHKPQAVSELPSAHLGDAFTLELLLGMPLEQLQQVPKQQRLQMPVIRPEEEDGEVPSNELPEVEWDEEWEGTADTCASVVASKQGAADEEGLEASTKIILEKLRNREEWGDSIADVPLGGAGFNHLPYGYKLKELLEGAGSVTSDWNPAAKPSEMSSGSICSFDSTGLSSDEGASDEMSDSDE